MIWQTLQLLPLHSLVYLTLSVFWNPALEPIWNLATVVAASIMQVAIERGIDRWFTS